MPIGVQVYRANGTTQMSATDRLSRVTGTLNITVAGSVTVDTTLGTPFGVIIPLNGFTTYGPPTISGGTISWTVTTGLLVYGVY